MMKHKKNNNISREKSSGKSEQNHADAGRGWEIPWESVTPLPSLSMVKLRFLQHYQCSDPLNCTSPTSNAGAGLCGRLVLPVSHYSRFLFVS